MTVFVHFCIFASVSYQPTGTSNHQATNVHPWRPSGTTQNHSVFFFFS